MTNQVAFIQYQFSHLAVVEATAIVLELKELYSVSGKVQLTQLVMANYPKTLSQPVSCIV